MGEAISVIMFGLEEHCRTDYQVFLGTAQSQLLLNIKVADSPNNPEATEVEYRVSTGHLPRQCRSWTQEHT